MNLERKFLWKKPDAAHQRLLKANKYLADHVAPWVGNDFHFRNNYQRQISLYNDCIVLDQKDLGSCVFNSVANGVRHAVLRMCRNNPQLGDVLVRYFSELKISFDPANPPIPSRLGTYYLARSSERMVKKDCGSSNALAADILATMGWCPESVWPYQTEWFATHPPDDYFRASFDLRGALGVNYCPLPKDLSVLKRSLWCGYPFVWGTLVGEEFSDPTGVLGVPKGRILGGHSMLAVGYDDDLSAFLVLNSWGPHYHGPGLSPGLVWVSYDYMLDETSGDYWCFPDPTGHLLGGSK